MTDQPTGVAAWTASQLATRIQHGDALVVLDVREPDERAFAAIPLPSAVTDLHIPMRQVPARLQEIADAASAADLVVYCHLGVRSEHVAQWLVRQGIQRVVNLEGGIDAWSLGVDPSVRRY